MQEVFNFHLFLPTPARHPHEYRMHLSIKLMDYYGLRKLMLLPLLKFLRYHCMLSFEINLVFSGFLLVALGPPDNSLSGAVISDNVGI